MPNKKKHNEKKVASTGMLSCSNVRYDFFNLDRPFISKRAPLACDLFFLP